MSVYDQNAHLILFSPCGNFRLESNLRSIEYLSRNIIYEFPNDSDDEYEDPPFMLSEVSPFEKKINIPNLKKQNDNMEASAEKNSKDLEDQTKDLNNEKTKADIVHDVKERISGEDSNVVGTSKNLSTPVYECVNLRSKSSDEALLFDYNVQGIRLTNYPSEEFADVEDNIKDSSSDNGQTAHNGINEYPSQSSTSKDPSDKYFHKLEPLNLVKVFNITEPSSSKEIHETKNPVSNVFSETKRRNIVSDKNQKAFWSALPKGNKRSEISSEIKISKEDKKTVIRQTMPVIPEITEPEDDNRKGNRKDSQPSTSASKTLKIKTKVTAKSIRCGVCNIRLGLCAIRCRCGNYYCAKHRYDREHNCTFDYRGMGEKEIRKNNPKVIGEKVRKL